jgi:hypothetical protein
MAIALLDQAKIHYDRKKHYKLFPAFLNQKKYRALTPPISWVFQ